MKTYNKLIRDKIPAIMTAAGKNFRTHIATDEEYTEKLKEKLLEEINEFLKEPCLEELADILAVLPALLNNLGYSEEQLVEMIDLKSKTRGDFEKRIILETVEE